MLEVVGTTEDGKKVVAGLYRVYESHGLPFVVIFGAMERLNAVPDWCALVREALSAGVKLDRIVGKIADPVSDVWGPEFRDHVTTTLGLAIEVGYFDDQAVGLK